MHGLESQRGHLNAELRAIAGDLTQHIRMPVNRIRGSVAVELHGHAKHQRGHRTNDHGIEKWLKHRDHPFGGRAARLDRRMRDRRRANARLVGESRTTHAPDKCRKQTTGDRRPRLKSLGDDATQSRDDFRRVDHQHDQATHDIGHTHDRHHLVGHLGNALDAADDHKGGHQCHDRSKDPLLIGKERLLTASDVHQLRGDLVHLENIAAAKGRQHTHHRKKSRKHQTGRLHAALGETFSQIIHRTTMHTTRGIKLAVFNSQCAFRKFRRHANETAEEKPERDTGSAILNPDRNTRNVAKPHRARYRGTQRLKMRDLTRIGW